MIGEHGDGSLIEQRWSVRDPNDCWGVELSWCQLTEIDDGIIDKIEAVFAGLWDVRRRLEVSDVGKARRIPNLGSAIAPTFA